MRKEQEKIPEMLRNDILVNEYLNVLWYSVLLTRHERTGVGKPSAAHSSSILPFTVTSWSRGIRVIVGGTVQCITSCRQSAANISSAFSSRNTKVNYRYAIITVNISS